MPRLQRFTFCFFLFVAQLAPSLPFSFAARLFPTLRPSPASVPPILPTPRTFFFFFAFVSFFAPLSLHQNRASGAKSAPFTFEYNRSRGFLRASGNSKLINLIFVFVARRLLVYFRQGWRCRLGCRELSSPWPGCF